MAVASLALAWDLAGGTQGLSRLGAADPGWLALALASTVPMQLLSAARWAFTAQRLGATLDAATAVREYYVASLLNATMPAGMAGDALRAWRHGRAGAGRLRVAVHAVVIERAAGQVALAVVVLAGVALAIGGGAERAAPLGLVVVGLAVAVVVVVGLAALGTRPRRALAALGADAARAFWPAGPLLTQVALSAAVIACYLGCFAAVAGALGVALGPLALLLGVPAVLYAMALPVSIGGFGLREVAAAAAWPLLDRPPADGVLCALVYGLVVLAGSLPGAVVLAVDRQAARSQSNSTSGPI